MDKGEFVMSRTEELNNYYKQIGDIVKELEKNTLDVRRWIILNQLKTLLRVIKCEEYLDSINCLQPETYEKYCRMVYLLILKLQEGRIDRVLKPLPVYSNEEPVVDKYNIQYVSPGGRESGVHYDFSVDDFENDEFGLIILQHYLFGKGKPLIIDNDRKWTEYMKASSELKNIVLNKLRDIMKDIEVNTATDVNLAFQGFMTNGESITGYNYLHGTVESEGDFQINGIILRLSDGSFMNLLEYTWNDIIDPNFNYSSDIIKSKIGEMLSFGQSADYKIKISWFSFSEISSNGDVHGWPFE
jgi:hypothetical protein